jgi:hypothetical protein
MRYEQRCDEPPGSKIDRPSNLETTMPAKAKLKKSKTLKEVKPLMEASGPSPALACVSGKQFASATVTVRK